MEKLKFKHATGVGQVHIALDRQLKNDSEEILKKMGLSISEAVRVFLREVVREREIPFPVHYSAKVPNDETIKAINQLESGNGEKTTLKALGELWDSL